MRANLVKQNLRAGKLQLGTGFGQLRSPEIPRMLAAAGFQWAFVDTEHGGFDLETVQDICRVSAARSAWIWADCCADRLRTAQLHSDHRARECQHDGRAANRNEARGGSP